MNPSHDFIPLIILLESELLKATILEENTNSKPIIVPWLMPEHTDDLLLDHVGKGLVWTNTLLVRWSLFYILLELMMAYPLFRFHVVVWKDVTMGHKHEALVEDELLERSEQVLVLLILKE